jgi:hypothetical protein
MGEKVKTNYKALFNRKRESIKGKKEMNTEANPPIMGNPAVVSVTAPGDDMRERQIMEPDMVDVADYSSKYQANPDMDKESKEYVQSRNYNTGGDVKVRGGGKAIRGMNFTGVK